MRIQQHTASLHTCSNEIANENPFNRKITSFFFFAINFFYLLHVPILRIVYLFRSSEIKVFGIYLSALCTFHNFNIILFVSCLSIAILYFFFVPRFKSKINIKIYFYYYPPFNWYNQCVCIIFFIIIINLLLLFFGWTELFLAKRSAGKNKNIGR